MFARLKHQTSFALVGALAVLIASAIQSEKEA
jgi:hypothetical protein